MSRRLFSLSLALMLLGALGLALGFVVDARRAWFAYLAAFVDVTSFAIGALVFLLIVHAMNAGWPTVVRRLIEAIAGVLPLCALLFIPIVLGARTLYAWHGGEFEGHLRPLMEHKRAWLNLPAFAVRGGLCLAIFIAVAELLRRSKNPRRLASAALPPIGIAVTLAAFDWGMSLEPTWFSTMYGVYFYAGAQIGSLGLLTMLAARAAASGALPLSPSHFYALGRLLLAFTIFWAYIAFFQFFLIWIADKPLEVVYYLARWRGGWRFATVALALLHFALPFFALLPYAPKRRARAMGIAGAYLAAVHLLDVHWLIVPVAGDGRALHWIDLAALLAVGGAAVAFAAFRARTESLAAVEDPNWARGVAYVSR